MVCASSLFTEVNVYAAPSVNYAKYRTSNEDTSNPTSFFNYASEFPYITHHVASLLNETTLVHNGMIILKNASQSELGFKTWGGTENTLVLNTTYKNGLIPLVRMAGSTGRDYGGFLSNNLDYRGRYISLIIGNVVKSSDHDFQVSFVIDIIAAKSDYHLIFVHGPLSVQGWIGNNYYEKIGSYSSRLIDVNNFIPNSQTYVKQIQIVMQKESTLQSLEFRIDLNRSTETPPIVLPGGNSYFVVGDIATPYNTDMKYSRYFFHNLGISRLVQVQLSKVPDDGKIINNSWDVSGVYKWKDDKTNTTNSILTGERQITFQELSPAVISNFDLYRSLMKAESKDWLFLVVVLTPLLLYRIRERNP